MTLESWHSQKNANQSINQSKINLPPPIRTHTYPARNGGYSWKEGRIVQLGTREREKERGKERGLQIGHIKSCSLCQERIFLLVVARDKQRSERVMVQRSLSVSPLPTQLLPRGWVKGRRGREGVESKEESGGGNCEEKVDGESVEIGGNACGWALTYSFSGPLGIVSLSPVSPTLHHPALWWSKVPKKGAAVLPLPLRDQSIHWPASRQRLLSCAKLLMYSRSSYRAILRFLLDVFLFSLFFFFYEYQVWIAALRCSCHQRKYSLFRFDLSPVPNVCSQDKPWRKRKGVIWSFSMLFSIRSIFKFHLEFASIF